MKWRILAVVFWAVAGILFIVALAHADALPVDAHTYLRLTPAEIWPLRVQHEAISFRLFASAWGVAVLGMLCAIVDAINRRVPHAN